MSNQNLVDAPKSQRARGPSKLFTRQDIARLLGVSVSAVYKMTRRRVLDPTSLEDICEYYHHNRDRILDRKYKAAREASAEKAQAI